MENLYELTPLHILEIWFKMENLYEQTPLHFLEIWFKLENLYELTIIQNGKFAWINPFTFS